MYPSALGVNQNGVPEFPADYADQTHATMYRDQRWKLVTYHGKDICELYDLQTDPWEHEELSGRGAYEGVPVAGIREELLRRSFDATVAAHPPDLPRTAPY